MSAVHGIVGVVSIVTSSIVPSVVVALQGIVDGMVRDIVWTSLVEHQATWVVNYASSTSTFLLEGVWIVTVPCWTTLVKEVFRSVVRGNVQRGIGNVVELGTRLHPKVLDISILDVLLIICISERIVHMLSDCNNLKVRVVLVPVVGIVIICIVDGICSRRLVVVSMLVWIFVVVLPTFIVYCIVVSMHVLVVLGTRWVMVFIITINNAHLSVLDIHVVSRNLPFTLIVDVFYVEVIKVVFQIEESNGRNGFVDINVLVGRNVPSIVPRLTWRCFVVVVPCYVLWEVLVGYEENGFGLEVGNVRLSGN